MKVDRDKVGKLVNSAKKNKYARAAGAGALLGAMVGSTTGKVTGVAAGRKTASDKFEKKAASKGEYMPKKPTGKELAIRTSKKGGTYQASGNLKKDVSSKLKSAVNAVKNNKNLRRAGKLGAVASGAAAGGYAAHKLSHGANKFSTDVLETAKYNVLGYKKKEK